MTEPDARNPDPTAEVRADPRPRADERTDPGGVWVQRPTLSTRRSTITDLLTTVVAGCGSQSTEQGMP